MDGNPADAATAVDRRPLGPAILRIAGWPIECLEPLRASELCQRIDRWIGHEDEIRHDSRLLAAQLHELIPKIPDRRLRGLALSLKRALAGTLHPLPDRLTGVLLQDAGISAAVGPALLALAADRERHAAERAAIEQAHGAEMQRAGTALDQIVGEAQFQRALCLASSSLYAQYRKARQVPPSRRGRQRLQSVLHRYLMRAIGRATPNGLWAGVALETVTHGARAKLDVSPAPAAIRASPVLSIFLRGLDHLNRRKPWMDQVSWRRNPTLRRIDDTQWEFGTFSAGYWVVGRIAHHAPLDILLNSFGTEDRPLLREIEHALCADVTGLAPDHARTICENWITGGILWSTASLPPFFSDTWQALDATIDRLPPSEQDAWLACRSALRAIADEIETRADSIEPDELRHLLDAANDAVAAVLARYGAALRRDEDVLAVDRKAPFRFSLPEKLGDRLAQTLHRYWAFDRFGLGEIETRIAISHFFDARDDACIPLGELLSRGGETDPTQRAPSWQHRVLQRAAGTFEAAAQAAFDRWEREIGPVAAQSVHRLGADDSADRAVALPPGSALLLIGRPTADGDAPLRIGGLTPEPCFFHSRFAHLFDPDDPFRQWHAAELAQATAQWPRIQLRDLAIRNHHNPNVTARPPSLLQLIDPLDTDSRFMSGARITFNRHGRPVLSADGDPGLTIASARSAAYLGGLDRMASVLASISFFLGRPPLMAPIPRLNREIEAWHHLPRLLLDDAVISPQRWTPDASVGTALARARGAERLIEWRRFVRARRLPDLVYTFQAQHQTESLLATDSALAVELLGQELQAHGPALRIQELWPVPDDFIVRDRDGRRYLAELAVPWHADDAFWQDYSSAVSEPAAEVPVR
ncbi:lantibiotic dehydratase [Bradyrhizobium sp. DOA9]|uniref:lantibiotic dehydratase n=1 Tax=Bradyrhizobium sp. DOA9 TaxID=1126627 RepID=UPI000469690D|nr:lantibiotic dehydratase [Bradyrhizobium sp. DOA9]GAJ33674.1 hypothetical protein BDOA9_0128720 [Bradyrhizobium sp. DOA9]